MATTATDLYLKKLRQKYKEKGATEQEAETMASQDQAQQEAQNGSNLNGWQKFGAGVEEFVDNMAQTFLDLGEGLVDSIAIGVGSIAEGVGDKNTANNIRGFVERDWTDELVNQGNAFGTGVDLWRWANAPSELAFGKEARDYSRQNDLLPDVVDSISSGIGSSLGMGALSSIPYVGWLLTGMAAGGASAEQELRNNPDLDITSAMGYGILNGLTEVASELLVGKVLGLIGKGINKAFGGSAVSETATRFGLGSSTGGNILTNLFKEFNEEGIEEVVSEFVDPIARKLTIEKDKPIGDELGETWGNAEWWINDVWTAYWQGGLSSVVMGGTGATANAIKAGGVKNYNAVLQVRQVAEINEQIKELESKNTDGKYDYKIEALTAQKENVIKNFQKNFEQFVNDYLKSQTEETLSKKEMRRASIGEEMNYEQNRNIRKELATETAVESGALGVSFDEEGKPSYAIKKDNFINYDGKKLSTKEWIKEVIHEIGHINVKDFSFVDSILQDVNAQDLQNAEDEYNRRYKDAYTPAIIKNTDYYKEEFEKTNDEAKALENARKKIIQEEIAMDRFASYFDNIGEFKRAISGEKLSLIERLKERFTNTYKHVEKAQKPKNYDSIIKALREAVEDTKKRRENILNGTEQESEEKDIRYKVYETDNNGRKLSEQQQKYFKDSVVRDKDGNLLMVYHTTRHAGFTVFNPNRGSANYSYKGYVVNFFTNNRNMSVSYGDGEIKEISKKFDPYKNEIQKGQVYETYLNITNPYIVDAKKSTWDYLSDKLPKKIVNYEIQQIFDKISKKYSSLNGDNITTDQVKAINEELNELRLNNSNTTVPLYDWKITFSMKQTDTDDFLSIRLDNGYSIDIDIPLYSFKMKNFYNEWCKDKITKFVNKQMYETNDVVKAVIRENELNGTDYDGVIIRNVNDYVNSETNDYGDVYVTIKAENQVKDSDNVAPTIDKDIRWDNEETVNDVDSEKKADYIRQAKSVLKTIDESKIDDVNDIIKKMNEATSNEELDKLADSILNLMGIEKENTNEQNLQRPNETGTETVRQGVSGDNGEVSKGSTGSENISRLESKSDGTILGDAVRNDNSVRQEVGIEPGTSDRLYRGSREWARISDTKNGYNSKLRRTSNKGIGRGRDRILNLYRYGEFIRENINIATTPTNINGDTYSVIKDEALPEFLLDMRKEFQKVSTAKGLDIYFFVSDANDTRNGFAVNDNIITIRLDSSATNTALHELSHILSKMVSNSYNKAFNSLFKEYFVKNKSEYKELYEPIKNNYEKKYKPRFVKQYGVNSYEKLNAIQQKSVDNKVEDLLNEELFCAIIQGKTKIQDRSFHNKLVNDYLADIKTEYGADLAQYYYNGFINADEIEVKPEDIKMSKYTPVEIINPTPTNKKIGLETYSQYLERMNKLVTSFRNKVDTLESMTDFNKILPNYEILKDYRLNLKRTFRDLKNYKIEWENAYKADFEILAAKYEEVKNLFVEYSDKFEARKDKDGNKIPSLLDTLTAKADKLKIIDQYKKEKKELLNYLSRDRLKGNETYLKQAQNLAEIIETRYNTAIENTINFYDNKIYEQIKQAIDTLWNNFSSENKRISELLNKGELAENKEKETEKKIKKRLNRGELTYSVEDEAKRLKELKETLKPNLKEVQDVVHTYSKLIKSAKSKYINYNLNPSAINDTHRPLGKKAKINLHEKLVKYINDLTTKIDDYRKLAEEYTKDETFRKTNLYREIYETITTLENKIGTTLDGDPEETLYGLKNTLYVDIVKYNNSNEKYAEIISKQSASTKKEIKDTIKDIERNIPNEANDLIDNLEEQIEKYKELASQYEEQSEKLDEINKYVSELEAKLKKAKTQLGNALKKAPKRVELWKNKYANAMATIKDLKDELKRYKKEILENDSPDKINLKEETSDYAKKYSALEKELNEQKQINEKVQKELKNKKAEYSKKVTENKNLTKKINELRKKLVLSNVNGKVIIKVDNNFYKFMNELMNSFQKDMNYKDDFFSYSAMQRFALDFANNDSADFAQTLIDELEAKGYDKELLALENGEHLYYESNFSDLVELVFTELKDFKNSELTNVGKLMVRLENAKTDYKLLQEAYKTNLRVRTASTKVKAFINFFTSKTKNTSSRLNGVDKEFREPLVKFVENLRNESTLDDVANGTLRRNILNFFNELQKTYNDKIEVNGVALDSGILDMVKYLQNEESEYKKYIEDLRNTAEFNEKKYRDSYKISDTEAKLYRELFNGLRRYTDDVMHNRYWTIGDVTLKGVAFTRRLVSEVQNLKNSIKKLNWNPLTKMYVTPRNIFRELSGYQDNALVMELYKELEKGTIRTMEAKMDLAKPIREFFDSHKDLAKELQRDSKKYNRTINFDGKSITTSTTVLLDLYEALQNQNNKAHILNDGIEIKGLEIQKYTENELDSLEKALYKEFNLGSKKSVYAQYLDLLNTMYEKAKKYKIETDIRARGFTNIQEGFYYPTNVSDFNLNIDLSSGAFNLGNTYGGVDLVTTERNFNKGLQSTRGAVKLVNSYEKMLQHINGMASYYGVDSSILNFSKLYRYRVEGGMSNGNIIRQLYGKDYKMFDRYLGELFKDMRGTNNPSTGTDLFIKKIEKLVRGGVVTATLVNPKVIATQPASLITAMKYVSPKHILSSLNNFGRLSDKFPPLPTVGAYRYFDQSALQAETGGVDNKLQKTLGKAISSSDHGAINVLWPACCKQVGLLQFEKGSAEYNEALKKATDLFTRVVNDTQPNNSALGKAEIMRSDNEVVKLLTMYRSQAMQNFNIAYDAINQLRTLKKIAKAKHLSYAETKVLLSKPKKELARALASLILEGALFTFIGQLFSHFVNNDWDDEDFWAHALQDYSIQYFNDNILGIMPVLNKLELELNDELSVSFDNITMGWLENMIESIQKVAEGGSPKEFIKVFSYATGIPIATNYKYTKAIIQYIAPEFAYEFDAVYNGTSTKSKSAINYALNDKQYDKAYELYKKYTSYSMEFDVQTTKELFNLYKQGYTDTTVKTIPTTISYDGKTITVDEKQFKDIYSKVAKKINQLTKSSTYRNMTADKKAETIKYLLNMYYSLARKNITGQDLSFVEKILLNDMNLTVDKLLLIKEIKDIEADENLTKKEKTQQYINKLKTNKAYKYFLYMASGYSLSDDQKKYVKSYLINNGLSWKKASAVL